ncbi:MAG TPA: PEP-CTERM sorting domain-containing protein [Oscillatoriaceae cyanobacterium M33_DOE_052]|uniref:PEP-CTERM sorting domain-containing protein n=1 Tax=Planktothricoides sp. SpSt-374 TaxID=2282167 RepID=A0A7C3VTF9_9CYAN|nr:PEP-CTERM sorting domain-containing protein [Oscillatoriaceae cyanobacterium M33_DOE_052]
MTFDNITGNYAPNALTGETQLFLDVTDATGGENLSANQVLFKLSNAGPAASSITQIYFEDMLNSLSGIATNGITGSGSGVSFSVSTGNLNLPGGNDSSVNFTEEYGVRSLPPVQPRGVNPGEWVSVLFNLNSGQTLQNVFDNLASQDMRVGIHVQGFANGGSESFVNLPPRGVTPPPAQVPEPATLLGLGLVGGLMAGSRRRKNSDNA